MTFEEYWMGKGIDLDALWDNYESGQGYVHKVSESELHLLRLTFSSPPSNIPLFDHELIYKTVKGTFHDVKKECFSKERYNHAAPIFLRKVDRGSGIFEFLGQFDPVLTWVAAISGGMLLYRKLLSADQDYDDKRLGFLLKHFPQTSQEEIGAYMKAWTTFGRRKVMQRLIAHGLQKVEVSTSPVTQEIEIEVPSMLDIEVVLTDDGGEEEQHLTIDA
ncbi:MAG TPA: hypothetical protein PKE12_14460 [Kiritimatiellia bacterium]|nr:hypothetical protein [Kiritimatiellia bacterium]